jgi:hypothetical protein
VADTAIPRQSPKRKAVKYNAQNRIYVYTSPQGAIEALWVSYRSQEESWVSDIAIPRHIAAKYDAQNRLHVHRCPQSVIGALWVSYS